MEVSRFSEFSEKLSSTFWGSLKDLHRENNEKRKRKGMEPISLTEFIDLLKKNQSESDSPACDAQCGAVNKKWKTEKEEAPVGDKLEILNGAAKANTKSGIPKHDKPLSVPVAIMGTAVPDSQNKNTVAASKSIEGPLFPEVNNMVDKVSNITGSKRPTPECLVNPLNRSSTNNSGGGHLVYVRRRPEGELSKTAASNNHRTDDPQLKKLSKDDEKTQGEVQMKEAQYHVSDISSNPRSSLTCSLSTNPSAPPSTRESNTNLGTANVSNHQVTPTDLVLDKLNKHWEERYGKLKNLLQKLEQSKQEDYVQMLRSLSSVDLSKHAVELEKRSIRLALEEAKEVQRVRVVDVLGKYPKNPRVL